MVAMDTEDGLIYEEKPFHGIKVKAATIDKLVTYCLDQFDIEDEKTKEISFVKVFFLTYHWYISAKDLMKKFIELYENSGKDDQKDYHKQVFLAVKYWMDNYGGDFEKNEEVLSELTSLNTKIHNSLGGNGYTATLSLDKWIEKKDLQRMKIDSPNRRPSLNFNEMSGKDLGEQVLYLNWKGLRKVPVTEWKIYGKTAKTEKTPLLKEQITLFNNISKYVIAMILNKKTVDERAKSVQTFISLARRLMQLNDYNTLLAVIGGLGHSAVTRLHKTMELLSVEDQLFIKETLELLASAKNYGRYRSKIENIKHQWLSPILGVVMHDLVALETATSDYVESNSEKLINFHKMVLVSNILEQILRVTQEHPDIHPKKEVFKVIRVSLKTRYSEDDLYELSLQREPRQSGSSRGSSVSSTCDSPVFADWASCVAATPDRQTVEKHVNMMVKAVFKTYDVDKNGSINKEEFDALATNFPFIDNFAVLDVNCDGNISEQEMLNYFMNANAQEMTKEFLHNFQETSFYSPHYCVYCMGFLWGIGKSGYRCKDCQISCHKDCKNHVVMECRPTHRTGSLPRALSSKSHKRRLKYADQEWSGSTDSQLSSDPEYPSPKYSTVSSMNDVFSKSFELDHGELKLRQRIAVLEMEKEALRKENLNLKGELTNARSKITTLETQLGGVRQQSVRFMLEQMERLHTCKETDV